MKTPTRLDAFQDIPAIHIYEVDREVNEEVKRLLTHPETYYYDDPENVWEKNLPELNGLFQAIVCAVANYAQLTDPSQYELEFDGWCVTSPDSNTHLQKHDHAEHADLVVTYYAVNDNPDGQGDIIMYHADNGLALQYRPHPGSLLIFPGSWEHQVTPYTGSRLAVATNIRIVKHE